MGDRFQRKGGRLGFGANLMHLRGKPPPTIVAWGLGELAQLGHNNGPPFDDDTPGYVWRRYRWTKAHDEVWKTPSMGVLKFRMTRADAAGMSYRDYMLALLDTGRHAQAKDRDGVRTAALAAMRATWTDVISRAAPQSPRMQRSILLASLTAAYDEDGRAYHNLSHIGALLADLTVHGAAVIDRDALALAILYHDVIYAAKRTDNETASAALAKLHLTDLGCDPALVARVEQMVLATRHRLEDVAAADPDTALLLDLDLAVLASPSGHYLAYAGAIRFEYAHVPDAAWRVGRARVLQAFLDRPTIYATPALAALWDAQARANLARELACLAQPSPRGD